MPPRLGLYSLANTPEELLSQGYGMVDTEFAEDPAFGNLTYNTSYNPAPYTGAIPFQNVFRISEGVSNNFDNPSYGGSGNPRFNQFEPEGVLSQVDSRFPLYDDFTVAEGGDDLEDNAVTVDELGNLKQPSGFKDFLKTMLGFAIPGAGLFMGDRSALEGIKSLNQRIQQSDFGQATSLMDYLDMRKYGGLQGRNDAAARNMAQARGITKSLASRPSSTSGGYQKGPGGSGAQTTSASKSQSQAGPGFSGSGSAAEMGSF